MDDLCSKGFEYGLRFKNRCEKYFKCYNNLVTAYICPDGQHFNQETNQCDDPCNARCDPDLGKKIYIYIIIKRVN